MVHSEFPLERLAQLASNPFQIGFARQVADRVLMQDGGEIIEDAPPDRFFDAPEQERTRRFLRAVL